MTVFERYTQGASLLFMAVIFVPITAGVVGVILPAFGYFPALGSEQFNLQAFHAFFAQPSNLKMIQLSFTTGVMATVIAVTGTFVILAFLYNTTLLSRVQRLISPLLVLPHAGIAIALLFVLSPAGLFSKLLNQFGVGEYGLVPVNWVFPYDEHGVAIVFALALKELPFILLMALGVMAQPQVVKTVQGYSKAAIMMGNSPESAFFKVVLPVIYPQIRLPILAVLAFSTANVEIPLLLGPNNPATLGVAVVQWFNHVDLSLRFQASAAAMIQVGVTLSALLVWCLIEKGIGLFSKTYFLSKESGLFKHMVKFFATGILTLYAIVSALVLFSVIMWSFSTYWTFSSLLPDGLTLLHWQTALGSLGPVVLNTVALGGSVSVVAVVLTLLTLEFESAHGKDNTIGYSPKVFAVLLFLPLLVPGVAFLYGLVWFQQRFLPDTIFLSLFIAHLVYVLPYVFISLAVAYRKLDSRYEQVASSLGKTPWQVFTQIKLPLLISPLLVALALGIAISVAQYLPTLLVAAGQYTTITTEAVALASGSSRRLTAVYVVIQALLPWLFFSLAWWLSPRLFSPSERLNFFKRARGV